MYEDIEKQEIDMKKEENEVLHSDEQNITIQMKEKYDIYVEHFGFENEMLFSNELKEMGYQKDNSVYLENEKRDIDGMDSKKLIWFNNIIYSNGEKKITGTYDRQFNGIVLQSNNLTLFEMEGLNKKEIEQFMNVLKGFGVEPKLVKREQVEKIEKKQAASQQKFNDETISNYLTPKEYFKQKNLKRIENIEKNIPQEMKELEQWCVFKTFYNKETKERKKIILQANNAERINEKGEKINGIGMWASCNKREQWSSFEEALSYAKENNCEGLSFTLTKESGVMCVDLDSCINDKNMRTALAWEMLNASSGTYAEKSVSGSGIHIFFKGDGNSFKDYYQHVGNKKEQNEIECYSEGKFMSVTGNIISQKNMLKESELLEKALKERLGKRQVSIESEEKTRRYTNERSLTGNELLEKIRKSKVGDTFDRLMRGEDMCGDKHRSDAKLMNIIGFFSNYDRGEMRSVFESSGLYRASKNCKYVDRTIDYIISKAPTAGYTKKETVRSKTKGNNNQQTK